MSEHTPIAKKVEDEWTYFVGLWQRRRGLAILLSVGLVCFLAWSGYAAVVQGRRADELDRQIEVLNSSLREAERENRGLRETVAPLLARAAREFPGEEINQSLKKLLQQLEADRVSNKPLASASITVDVFVRSKDNLSAHFMDQGGYAVLASDADVLLTAWSNDSYGQTSGAEEVRFRAVFQMSADDKMVGRPLSSLSDAQYIRIELAAMPENLAILRGKAIVVLNGSLRVEFEVPAQEAKGRRILVPNIQDAISALLQG